MAGNANSGRRPQPTALKVLRGNPSKTRLNAREPKPPTADFDTPPIEVSGDPGAMAEWSRVVPMLRACGVITTAEKSVIVALCQQWSRYLEANMKVLSLGMIVKKPSGIPMVNPYLAVSDKALQHCMKLWVELGLTPAGRSRMSAMPTEGEPAMSKWDGLL